MTISPREKRMLTILGAAVAVWALFQFVILSDSSSSEPAVQVTQMNSDQLRQRVALLRQTAATLPLREAILKQTNADLTDRERGIIQSDTFAVAQAELGQIASRVGKTNQLEIHSSDFAAPKVFGDYGIVYANVTFDCHIEQLLNFLADLTHEQALIVPSEERITSAANSKDKLMTVRMTLAGVVAKKLIPEKKGLGAF